MPYEPSLQATLLRRRNMGALTPDTYSLLESYYEPSDRASHAYLTSGEDPTEFTLPITVIVDRWCLAAGVAPYTEARVHRTGAQGAIAIDYVDGVTSCQIVCTLGVTLTAVSAGNGRADLTATLNGAQGPVLLSLDGFQTAGLPPETTATRVYPARRAGTYTVTARETRPGGCSATATVTFDPPYALRYTVNYKDVESTSHLLEVFEREYVGDPEELEAQEEPATPEWAGGPTDHLFSQLLRGSGCDLALYLMRDDQLLPLFSGDERLHRVDYSRAGALKWRGYLLPEQYDVAFLAPPTVFNLSASDGLGALSTMPFVGSAGEALRGDWTVLRTILFCLGKLDTNLPLNVLFNLFPNGTTTEALERVSVDVAGYQDEKGVAWDCGRVLEELLRPHDTRLMQREGAWWLERLSELTTGALTYLSYAPGGTRLADVVVSSWLQTINPPEDGQPHWQEGEQRQNLRPAVGAVSLAVDPGELTNLLRFALPANADLPGAYPALWAAGSPTPGTPWSELLYAAKDDAPTLRLIGTPGPVGGYPSFAAQNAAAVQGAWVQTPLTLPLPLPFAQGGPHDSEQLILSFKVKAYGFTPNLTIGHFSFLPVGLHYGNAWLAGISGQPETTLPQAYSAADFDTSATTIEARVLFGGTIQAGPQPVYVRFYAPIGGATATTVDISDIRLEYATGQPLLDDSYTTIYEGDTGQLVSRVDADTTLFHADVPHARRQGAWLEPNGRPLTGWQEAGGTVREAGDFWAQNRLRWQALPAQQLLGTVRGAALHPGVLLTDPSETRPAVYVLTSATYRPSRACWELIGVQSLLLTAPPETLPDGAIYFDDDYAWEAEDGAILIYEDATP